MNKIMKNTSLLYHNSAGYTFWLLFMAKLLNKPIHFADGTKKIQVPNGKGGTQDLAVASPKVGTINMQEHYQKSFKSIAEANGIETINGTPDKVLTFVTPEERKLVDWNEALNSNVSLTLPSMNKIFTDKKELESFQEQLKKLGKNPYGLVSQKLKTDDPKLSQEQKSIGWDFVSKIQDVSKNWVLLQHFAKNELKLVNDKAKKYNTKIFDHKNTANVLGWRGIDFAKQAYVMKELNILLNIASTTSWMGLTMFPNMPQVIYYAKKDSNKIWEDIGKARKNILTIPFDQNSDLNIIAQQTREFTQKQLSR
ncbi:MAG: hypothetical protein ACTSXL_06195 [Alphaproteobacteria bacterium]